eukprot:3044979-Pyramimonas_sp.AAC.1
MSRQATKNAGAVGPSLPAQGRPGGSADLPSRRGEIALDGGASQGSASEPKSLAFRPKKLTGGPQSPP